MSTEINSDLFIAQHPTGIEEMDATLTPYQVDVDDDTTYYRYTGGDEKVWIVRKVISGNVTTYEKTYAAWADRTEYWVNWMAVSALVSQAERDLLASPELPDIDGLELVYTITAADTTIILPFVAAGTYDLTIDWSDDTERSTGTDGSDATWYTHTFSEPGVYIVTCSGTATHLNYSAADATSREALTKVSDLNDLGYTHLSYAFYQCTNLGVVKGSVAFSDTVVDTQYMFYGCTNVTPYTSDWDVSNVTNMTNMFYGCNNADPDVSSWDVGNVTNMLSMFNGALSADPDVSAWDTSVCTNMNSMFRNAETANPDVSNWDTGSVIDMRTMFFSAVKANPDTSNWDTSSCTNMGYVFQAAVLANPDVSGWDTSNVTNMSSMFSGATAANPDTTDWDTSSCSNFYYMFSGATSANPDVSGWDTSNVTNMQYMFSGATSANPDVSGWDTSNVTNMQYMFYGATLANPNVTDWDMSKVMTINSMFRSSSANPDTSSWDLSSCIDARTAFYNLTTMTTLVPAGSFWCNAGVVDYGNCFAGATNIANYDHIPTTWGGSATNEELTMVFDITAPDTVITLPFIAAGTYDVSISWGDLESEWGTDPSDTSWYTHTFTDIGSYTVTVAGSATHLRFYGLASTITDALISVPTLGDLGWTNFQSAFRNCVNLTTVSGGDVSAVTDMSYMFSGATSADPDVSAWNTGSVINMADMFNRATSADPDVSSWNTENVIQMSGMFNRITSNPDVSLWNTSNVTTMAWMFTFANSANPDVSDWDVSSVTTMQEMFCGCDIANPDVSEWTMTAVTNIASMFSSADLANPDTSLWEFTGAVNVSAAFYNCPSMTNAVVKDTFWNNSDISSFANCFGSTTTNIVNYADIPGTWKDTTSKLTMTFETVDVDQLVFLNFTTLGEYCCFIDWAGEATTSGTDPSDTSWYSHTFATPGQYTVTIDGYATHLSYFDHDQEYRDLLITVDNLGAMGYTNLDYAFYECTNLVDFDGSDTSLVTSMVSTFYGAINVEPDIATWNTSNVAAMDNMFYGCSAANPDVSLWDVSNVVTMTQMFYNCVAANPDVSGWVLSSCTDISSAFSGCASMTNAVPAAQFWNNPSITSYVDCFAGATSISNYAEIPEGYIGVEPPQTTPLQLAFTTTAIDTTIVLPFTADGTYDLTIDWGDDSADSTGTDGSDASWYTHTFADIGSYTVTCSGTATHLSSLNTNATSRNALVEVTNLGAIGWTNLDYAFYYCVNLVDVLEGDTQAVTSMNGTFYHATSADPDVSGWDTSACTDMRYMFNVTETADPDVSLWDVSSVTTMQGMFNNAIAANPDVSGWDVSSVESMTSMFEGVISANPNVTNWDTGSVTDMSSMFKANTSANPDTTNWDTSNVTTMENMFYQATSADPDVSGWDTSNVTNMSSMFSGATSANPDVSSWDVSSVISIYLMFSGATAANPDVSDWDVSKVVNMVSAFMGATAANPDVSNWNTVSLTSAIYAFKNCTSMTYPVPASAFWDRVPAISGKYQCFNGAVNIENYADIPITWK